MSADYTAIVLVLFYAFAAGLGINQLYRVANSKNYKFSLRSGILFFLTLGSLIRVLFWIKVATPTAWPNQIMALIFFIPVWMQFVGYSLLLVFYSAALSDSRSRGPLKYAVSVDGIFLIICFTISILMKDPTTTKKDKEIIEIVYFTVNALLDFIMVAGLSYFGYRFSRKQTSRSTVATRILPRSPMMFLYVNWVLVAMSSLRGIFNIILITLITRQDRLEMIYFHSDGGRHVTPYYLGLYFIAMEFVPVVCIIVTVWKRPSSSSSKKSLNKAPMSTEAERAAANSIDEQSGIVVRHFGRNDRSPNSKAATPPAWWSSFISAGNMGGDESCQGNEGPCINEDASDDDYMMFKGVIVRPGSATGDAVQIGNMTRNHILTSSSPLGVDTTISNNNSYSSQTSYMKSRPPGGPILIKAPSFTLNQHQAGSPLAAASGTPPSFDTWMKNPRPAGLPSPLRNSSSGTFEPAQGSPILHTSYQLHAESLLPSMYLPPSSSVNSLANSESGSYVGHSDHVIQHANRASTNSAYRSSDASVESNSHSDPNNQDIADTTAFEDSLSPRDILLAQQKQRSKAKN